MYKLSHSQDEFRCDFPRDFLEIIYYKLHLAYSIFYKLATVAIRVYISKFAREIFMFWYADITGSRAIEYHISSGVRMEFLFTTHSSVECSRRVTQMILI